MILFICTGVPDCTAKLNGLGANQCNLNSAFRSTSIGADTGEARNDRICTVGSRERETAPEDAALGSHKKRKSQCKAYAALLCRQGVDHRTHRHPPHAAKGKSNRNGQRYLAFAQRARVLPQRTKQGGVDARQRRLCCANAANLAAATVLGKSQLP